MPNYRVVFREEVERVVGISNCRTPEEAEAIATDIFENDLPQDGNIISRDITDIEVQEVDGEEPI